MTSSQYNDFEGTVQEHEAAFRVAMAIPAERLRQKFCLFTKRPPNAIVSDDEVNGLREAAYQFMLLFLSLEDGDVVVSAREMCNG
jgi:hypothetical protein